MTCSDPDRWNRREEFKIDRLYGEADKKKAADVRAAIE